MSTQHASLSSTKKPQSCTLHVLPRGVYGAMILMRCKNFTRGKVKVWPLQPSHQPVDPVDTFTQRRVSPMPSRPTSHETREDRKRARHRWYSQQRRERVSVADMLRSTSRWRHLRQVVLRRSPVCADPYGWHAAEGRVVLAREIDHILSLARAPALAFVDANLQGLCRQCHGRKSQEERWEPQRSDLLSPVS